MPLGFEAWPLRAVRAVPQAAFVCSSHFARSAFAASPEAGAVEIWGGACRLVRPAMMSASRRNTFSMSSLRLRRALMVGVLADVQPASIRAPTRALLRSMATEGY